MSGNIYYNYPGYFWSNRTNFQPITTDFSYTSQGFYYPYAYLSNQRTVDLITSTDCNGLKNFASDIGIVSFVLSLISGIFGLFTLGLSLINQLQTNISIYGVGLPSVILAQLELFYPLPLWLSELYRVLAILDISAVVKLFGPLGDFINIVDIFGNGIGIFSLILGWFATFPEENERIIKQVFGIDLEVLLREYSCNSI